MSNKKLKLSIRSSKNKSRTSLKRYKNKTKKLKNKTTVRTKKLKNKTRKNTRANRRRNRRRNRRLEGGNTSKLELTYEIYEQIHKLWPYFYRSPGTVLGRGKHGAVFKVKLRKNAVPKKNHGAEYAALKLTKVGASVISNLGDADPLLGLAHLGSPNILKIYTPQVLGPLPGKQYAIVCEYIDGISLGQMLEYFFRYPDSGVSWRNETSYRIIIKQLLEGLVAIHSNGWAHRDIKPDNIMITRDGIVKLIDFGHAVNSPQISFNSHPCGTPNWWAPEMMTQQTYDPKKSDIFSAGLIASCLFTQTTSNVFTGNRGRHYDPLLSPSKAPSHWKPYFEGVGEEIELTKFTDKKQISLRGGYFLRKLLSNHTERPDATIALTDSWIRGGEMNHDDFGYLRRFEGESCMLCNLHIFWRHHCRKCGKLICGSCSNWIGDKSEIRVCYPDCGDMLEPIQRGGDKSEISDVVDSIQRYTGMREQILLPDVSYDAFGEGGRG